MKRYILLLSAASAAAQAPLSVKDAVRLALRQNPSIAAANSERTAARSRVAQARSALLPKVDYAESWTRSDNPVFVFSSLLTQHQFGEQNFQIGPLNRPDFLNNFQTLLTADQNIYDGGRSAHAVQSARLAQDIAGESAAFTQTEIAARVARAYYDAALAEAEVTAANQSLRSAEADLKRAQDIRAAGMSTDSDVLSIRVHLAAIDEQRIRRVADLAVARAALNEALGLALDTDHTLTTPLARVNVPELALGDYESAAVAGRPEARQAKLAADLAQSRLSEARADRLPQITLHTAFEADRQRFYDRGGANWLVSLGLHWNLFNGSIDKARIEESKSLVEAAAAQEQSASAGIRLQVRRAYADLNAAEQRIEAVKAAVDDAEESLRIVQNRYSAGMANVTDLLRTETAALDARTRYLAAVHDQRVAAVLLELAAGKLSPDSEVFN